MHKKKTGDFVFILTLVTFFGTWLYVASHAGWLWGVFFGWIPAGIFAWAVMFFAFLFTMEE